MAYRIHRTDSIQESVRKIAFEQIDKAIGEVMDPAIDRHEAVHQVRKRCKKVRGLIRLVRPVFDDFPRENKAFRDAARELSHVRDAQSIIDCFEALMRHYQARIDQTRFASVAEELAERRQEIVEDRVGLDDKLEGFLTRMREARVRAGRWQIAASGFTAVEGGLKKTYGRARKAMHAAYRDPSTENFHAWRKRVKYHWYHTRLLHLLWPEMMDVPRAGTDALAESLGDDHDLAVLRQTLRTDPSRFGRKSDLQVMIGLIDRRRAELQAQARPPGKRIFAEKPKHLASRLHCYWKTWWKTRCAPSFPDVPDVLVSGRS